MLWWMQVAVAMQLMKSRLVDCLASLNTGRHTCAFPHVSHGMIDAGLSQQGVLTMRTSDSAHC